MRLQLQILVSTLLSHLVRRHTGQHSELVQVAHLLFFVVLGCTNLAATVPGASLSWIRPIQVGSDWAAVSSVFNARRLSASGTGAITTDSAGSATRSAVIPIASIDRSMTNREVIVEAMVTSVRTPSSGHAPYMASLSQDDATIPLVFWSDILPPDILPQLISKVKTGNLVRAKVAVGEYRNHLQVRLLSAANLEVISPAAVAARQSPRTSAEPIAESPVTDSKAISTNARTAIGKVKSDWVDRVVTISGTIASIDSIGGGLRLDVQDGTGGIQVIVWDYMLSGISETEFRRGRVITVTGPIRLYRDRIEVAPEKAGDVKLPQQ